MKSAQKLFPSIDAMIIGAQKAATTSLKNYLMQHPQIAGHIHKEFAFFQDDEEFQKGYGFAYNKYFKNGQEIGNKKIIAKHASLYAFKKNIERFKEHNPDAVLIFSLRNPIDRAYSSFLMEYNWGSIKDSFGVIKNIIEDHQRGVSGWMYRVFIGLSLYCEHLEIIYNYFPQEQVYCFLFDELSEHPMRIFRDIFNKMRIDENFIPDVSEKHNVTRKWNSVVYSKLLINLFNNQNPLKRSLQKIISYKKGYQIGSYLRELNKSEKPYQAMDTETRKYLVDFFYPYNRKLEKITGFDLSHWDK